MGGAASRTAFDKVESELRRILAQAPRELVVAYLFGSVARGEARSDSDVDVAILLADGPRRTLDGLPFRLEAELERALGRTVQVVVLNTAPPDLVHRVLRDGRLLAERDRAARIAFEVRARNEFFDLQPILDRYRRVDRRSARA